MAPPASSRTDRRGCPPPALLWWDVRARGTVVRPSPLRVAGRGGDLNAVTTPPCQPVASLLTPPRRPTCVQTALPSAIETPPPSGLPVPLWCSRGGSAVAPRVRRGGWEPPPAARWSPLAHLCGWVGSPIAFHRGQTGRVARPAPRSIATPAAGGPRFRAIGTAGGWLHRGSVLLPRLAPGSMAPSCYGGPHRCPALHASRRAQAQPFPNSPVLP
jgi:hypothetical protein